MTPTRLLFRAVFILALAAPGAFAQKQEPDFRVPEGVIFRAADIVSEGTRMATEVFAPGDPKGEKLPRSS